MYTEHDAINKILLDVQDVTNKALIGKIGLLPPKDITIEYLRKIRIHVQAWLDSIDKEIVQLQKGLEDEKNQE